MAKKEMQKVLSQADMMNLLDSLYSKCIQGIPMISSPIEKMADDYLQHNATVEDAAKDMINKQVIKCTTSGFITNLGGVVITLPVTIPANVGSVMYVQMRMIACAAYMAGYDVKSRPLCMLALRAYRSWRWQRKPESRLDRKAWRIL